MALSKQKKTDSLWQSEMLNFKLWTTWKLTSIKIFNKLIHTTYQAENKKVIDV